MHECTFAINKQRFHLHSRDPFWPKKWTRRGTNLQINNQQWRKWNGAVRRSSVLFFFKCVENRWRSVHITRERISGDMHFCPSMRNQKSIFSNQTRICRFTTHFTKQTALVISGDARCLKLQSAAAKINYPHWSTLFITSPPFCGGLLRSWTRRVMLCTLAVQPTIHHVP